MKTELLNMKVIFGIINLMEKGSYIMKIDGKGKLYYENGNIKYEGDFYSGKYGGDKYSDYIGKGILYRQDGTIEYKGKFKYGEPDGCIMF